MASTNKTLKSNFYCLVRVNANFLLFSIAVFFVYALRIEVYH